MILKNANNDTCLSDDPIDGWTEITRAEYEAIIESRQVVTAPIPLPEPQPTIAELTAKINILLAAAKVVNGPLQAAIDAQSASQPTP